MKKNESWREATLFEGEESLLIRWEEGNSILGIVYHTTEEKIVIIKNSKIVERKDLSRNEKDSYDDALDYLISIAHKRPYHVLMN